MYQFFLALLAGVVTIGGPCILPLLPIILGTSTASKHPLRPVAIMLGFTVSFTGFALLFSVFGSFLGITPDTWRIIAVSLIALFGVTMLFPALQARLFAKLEPWIAKHVTAGKQLQKTDLWSGFLLGAMLGVVWTPCAGPVLGSILTLVAAKQNLAQAGALLFAFSLGAGVPMLLIAYGGQYAVQRVRNISAYAGVIQRVFGVLLVLTALAIGFRFDALLQAYLLEHYPWLFFGLQFEI